MGTRLSPRLPFAAFLTPALNSIADASASVFNVMNNYLAGRAYSRKLEEEADALGLEVIVFFISLCCLSPA